MTTINILTALIGLNHKELADALLGKTLYVGNKSAVILEAQGYPRQQNDYGVYKPILGMAAGQVYCLHQRAGCLILIVCNDKDGMPGSCVLIRAIDTGEGIIKGPAKTAKFFGITTHGLEGELMAHSDEVIECRFPTIESAPRNAVQKQRVVKPKSGNGIGQDRLKKLMPSIVKAYKRKPTGNFFQFLNELLLNCHDEPSLRKAIREHR